MEAALLVANVMLCGGVLYKTAQLEIEVKFIKRQLFGKDNENA